MQRLFAAALILAALPSPSPVPVFHSRVADAPGLGYYRFPALHGDTLVFTAEGDLWMVDAAGGVARRLTSGQGEETNATISPDGKTIAFVGSYEGPAEIYTVPVAGGVPVRRTWGGGVPVGWTPDGKLLLSSGVMSTLPDARLFTLDLATGARAPIPLAQAAEGAYDRTGGALYFTRFSFQGSHTKRYKGGTAQNLWKLPAGATEAIPLTADFPGTSKTPMWWQSRVYFVSDRDGSMNLWSMDADGHDLKQLTHHQGWDIQSPALAGGNIVYQLGADLWIYDIAGGQGHLIPVTLTSDFDQLRVRWVTKPGDYVTATHVSPNGDRVVLTARGQVFVAPVGTGRLVEASRRQGVRYRSARFAPDGKSVVVLSDESGETDWWRLPANGVGSPEPITNDARVLRWDGVTSPDGKYLAYYDKNQTLWLVDVTAKKTTRIEASLDGDYQDLTWSPDSKWLAYTRPGASFSTIVLYSIASGKATAVTTPRADSYAPGWSADGKWLYFLSDRTFRSLVGSPWGARAPEPFFDHQTKIYLVSLVKDLRSPFQAKDETPALPPDTGKKDVTVSVDFDGIMDRLLEVPVPAGNYANLSVGSDRIFYLSFATSFDNTRSLMSLEISSQAPKAKTVSEGLRQYELTADRKKLMIEKDGDTYVVDAASAPATLESKSQVQLADWTFPIDPREEFAEMFREAWRLERDYFYDQHMNGVDWPAMRKKYAPLALRVTSRGELSDVLAQMVSELSALHIFVYGGDFRQGQDQVTLGSLGATYERDSANSGWRVTHVYRSDPDFPVQRSPLAVPALGVAEGDVIQMVNGVPSLSVPDVDALLENQTGKQVLLRVKTPGSSTGGRDVVVTPISRGALSGLRYSEWEYTRRLAVDAASHDSIGYVHLRAMGQNDMAQFERDFYPALTRQGLIIDVRHNQGGNIDSWILEKLMRKAWMYWQGRIGQPYWNMQWAFRGHVVVLCDQWTASDGEAFSEGFRRLGLGKVIGARTWGGEIWLSSSNTLEDRGIATAAENGVYGPEGAWLIEGHGVDPDSVVDNLPGAAYRGQDAQLEAAIAYLRAEIKTHPTPVPPPPAYPDKSH
ncbi:MAG TPA: S41 family peptidase [Gemmatimonadales bacterium]|nr:S41 family peptidase [Gemmatimonadales bacterium]